MLIKHDHLLIAHTLYSTINLIHLHTMLPNSSTVGLMLAPVAALPLVRPPRLRMRPVKGVNF